MDDSTLPAVYRRPPFEMSERTRRWCSERWPFFGDCRRAQTICKKYDDASRIIARITVRETV